MTIYYASERPDLDESLILDVLQDRFGKSPRKGLPRPMVQKGVYRNDRQVRWKDIRWAKDRANPRTEILVEPMQADQEEIEMPEQEEPLPF